jgi:hypothetical protein
LRVVPRSRAHERIAHRDGIHPSCPIQQPICHIEVP